jgi:tetratricopeptide (TPR) repeat protein
MSRTTALKLSYVAAVALLASLALYAWKTSEGGLLPLVCLAIILLVPGRVQGVFFRDLFIGRRLLDVGHAEESVPYTERFITAVRKQPWRNKLLWLSWSVYTTNAEAMALNNLGAARIALGDIEAARSALLAARRVDPMYPLPPFNLAVVAAALGASEESRKLASEARELGYSGASVDQAVQAGQSLLAAIEGRQRTGSASRDA